MPPWPVPAGMIQRAERPVDLGDEVEVVVVVQNRGVVLERRRRDEQVRDRTPVLPEAGKLTLDGQRSRRHRLGEPQPRQRSEVVPTGLVVSGVASRVEQLEGDDLGHVERPVRGEGSEQPGGGLAVALLLEGRLVRRRTCLAPCSAHDVGVAEIILSGTEPFEGGKAPGTGCDLGKRPVHGLHLRRGAHLRSRRRQRVIVDVHQRSGHGNHLLIR